MLYWLLKFKINLLSVYCWLVERYLNWYTIKISYFAKLTSRNRLHIRLYFLVLEIEYNRAIRSIQVHNILNPLTT